MKITIEKQIIKEPIEIEVQEGTCYKLEGSAYMVTEKYLYDVIIHPITQSCRLAEITKWDIKYNKNRVKMILEKGTIITSEEFEGHIEDNIDAAREFLKECRVRQIVKPVNRIPEGGC